MCTKLGLKSEMGKKNTFFNVAEKGKTANKAQKRLIFWFYGENRGDADAARRGEKAGA